MVKIPDSKYLVEKKIEDIKIQLENRAYLGISSIAEPCPRKLWYQFRWCKKETITARQQRLFNRGHNEEKIIIKDLERIGVKVYGTQLEVFYGQKHIKGHCDGIGLGIPDAPKTPHLLEFKTANDISFKKVFIEKDIKKIYPVYYGQMLCYMFLLKLKRALFIMVNKNDDSRYYERISLEKIEAKDLLNRGADIILAEIPPLKIGDATYYYCKWCKFYDICHFGEQIDQTCRTCVYSQILINGLWGCTRLGQKITLEEQEKSCNDYELKKYLEPKKY